MAGNNLTTSELYDMLCFHETLTITIARDRVRIVKNRLIRKRYKERKALAEFADNLKLKFEVLPVKAKEKTEAMPDMVRLRISLVGETDNINEIADIELGENL